MENWEPELCISDAHSYMQSCEGLSMESYPRGFVPVTLLVQEGKRFCYKEMVLQNL